MYRAIDTICYRRSWMKHYPERASEDEGLLLILDPEQVRSPLEGVNRVAIRLGQGSERLWDVTRVESNGAGVVGLFFRGRQDEVVERGATVQVL